MAYTPQVVDAKIVSENLKNGLFEVLVELKDRSKCRIGFERTEDGEEHATHINRLFTEPCPVCRKDFLCNCMTRFLPTIAEQALQLIKTKTS
jgi:peptide subunit release factor 1 (eRF1)